MLQVGLSARSGIVRSGHLSPVRAWLTTHCADLPRTRQAFCRDYPVSGQRNGGEVLPAGPCARPVPGGVRLAGSGSGPELPASPRSRPINGPFIRTREDEWTIHQDRPDEWASSSSGLTPGRLMNDTFIRPGPAAPARHLRPAPGRPAQDAASTGPTPRTRPAQRRRRRPGGPATATASTPDPHSTRPPEPHNPGPPNRVNLHIHPRDPW